MAKIGVDPALTNVKQLLLEKRYEVIDLESEADAEKCDFCVITGMDTNIMGISNVITEGSVIEASGLTAEEVCQQLESKFQ